MESIEARGRAALRSLRAYIPRGAETVSQSDERAARPGGGWRAGLEHELFVVDERGAVAPVAEQLLAVCRETAPSRGLEPGCFEAECSGHLVEVKTPPCGSMQELSQVYLESLRTALEAARGLGLRLYPLGTYPLPVAPAARRHPYYETKARVLGAERFAHACRCAGLHIHLEAPPGSLRPDGVPSPRARRASRARLLDLYNLATALDPALVELGRSCPFYEGEREPGAARTLRYRGGFGVEAVYERLPEVGSLQPYAESFAGLRSARRRTRRAWRAAVARSGVPRSSSGGERLDEGSWNPVRLTRHGTVELRSPDANFPRRALALADLTYHAARLVLDGGLRVVPTSGLRELSLAQPGRLLVPDFECLRDELLPEAVLGECPRGGNLENYLRSLATLTPGGAASILETLGPEDILQTTEEWILQRTECGEGILEESAGLALVVEACERLEAELFEEVAPRDEAPLAK